MAAYKIFENLISSIETSRLNYILTRTPFSATISMKSSFAKFHENPEDENTKNENEESKEEKMNLQSKIKMLEENLKSIESEKKNLEMVYNCEKEKVKSSQEIEGQLRVELLKVKSEKNALISNNKSLQTRVDELERECDKKEDLNKDLQSQFKSKMKVLESLEGRVEGLTGDKDCSELMMTNLVSQLEQLLG